MGQRSPALLLLTQKKKKRQIEALLFISGSCWCVRTEAVFAIQDRHGPVGRDHHERRRWREERAREQSTSAATRTPFVFLPFLLVLLPRTLPGAVRRGQVLNSPSGDLCSSWVPAQGHGEVQEVRKEQRVTKDHFKTFFFLMFSYKFHNYLKQMVSAVSKAMAPPSGGNIQVCGRSE